MPGPYKVVIFDMDGVLFDKPDLSSRDDAVGSSSWDDLFDKMGIYDLHERLREIYVKKGFKSYMEWSDAACCVLKAKGLDRKTFDNMVAARSLMPGVKETFAAIKESRMITGVVSGSFEQLAVKARNELGINYILAHCDLEFDQSGMLKDWKLFATDYKDKIKFVKYIAQINKVSMKECAYIGDDVNDMIVFQRVGMAIAFNCSKQKVIDSADVEVKGKDLRDILPHIGITLPTKGSK